MPAPIAVAIAGKAIMAGAVLVGAANDVDFINNMTTKAKGTFMSNKVHFEVICNIVSDGAVVAVEHEALCGAECVPGEAFALTTDPAVIDCRICSFKLRRIGRQLADDGHFSTARAKLHTVRVNVADATVGDIVTSPVTLTKVIGGSGLRLGRRIGARLHRHHDDTVVETVDTVVTPAPTKVRKTAAKETASV